MANFLVTDLKVIDSPQAGIGVTRALKVAGHKIYGADDTPFVTTSDLFEKIFVLDEIRNLNLDSLVKKLITIRDAYKIDYVIPCYDETTVLFSFIKDKLDFLKINLIAPNLDVLRKIRKTNLENITFNQFEHPKTKVINSMEEAISFAEEIGYPVFVKGLTKGAIRVINKEELTNAVTRLTKIWNNGELNCIIQKEIIGKLQNALIAYKNNKIVCYVEMDKIGLDGNGATWFGRIKTTKDLFNKIEHLCNKIELNDCIIEFETIQNESGENHLYEINPRPPAWIYANTLNNQNFLEVFLNPQKETVFNTREVFFGKESSDFIKEVSDLSQYTNLAFFSKGAAYKTDNQKYPSELLL